MTCIACTELLIDYRFGELAEPERREVALHLAGCGACAVAYCRLDADVAGFGAALFEEPDPAVHRALGARVAAEFRPPLHRRVAAVFTRRVPVYQGALATLGAVAAVLLIAGPPGQEAQAPAPRAPVAAELAPTEAASAARVLNDYDASSVPAIDPLLL